MFSPFFFCQQSSFEVLHCERSAGEVETDELCEILVEGEELLQLRGCPAFPDSVSVPVLVLGVGLESDGVVPLSLLGSSLDGESERVAKEKLLLECARVCAAICFLSHLMS